MKLIVDRFYRYRLVNDLTCNIFIVSKLVDSYLVRLPNGNTIELSDSYVDRYFSDFS